MCDRIAERILTRLAPTLSRIIADGIGANLFRPQDPIVAPTFVPGSFALPHHAVSSPDDLPTGIAQLERVNLQGPGYSASAGT